VKKKMYRVKKLSNIKCPEKNRVVQGLFNSKESLTFWTLKARIDLATFHDPLEKELDKT